MRRCKARIFAFFTQWHKSFDCRNDFFVNGKFDKGAQSVSNVGNAVRVTTRLSATLYHSLSHQRLSVATGHP